MMTSSLLTEAGYTPENLETECKITFVDGKISLSELTLSARVPRIAEDEFQKIAENAKENCPVSQAFSFEKTLTAQLEQ